MWDRIQLLSSIEQSHDPTHTNDMYASDMHQAQLPLGNQRFGNEQNKSQMDPISMLV